MIQTGVLFGKNAKSCPVLFEALSWVENQVPWTRNLAELKIHVKQMLFTPDNQMTTQLGIWALNSKQKNKLPAFDSGAGIVIM